MVYLIIGLVAFCLGKYTTKRKSICIEIKRKDISCLKGVSSHIYSIYRPDGKKLEYSSMTETNMDVEEYITIRGIK